MTVTAVRSSTNILGSVSRTRRSRRHPSAGADVSRVAEPNTFLVGLWN